MLPAAIKFDKSKDPNPATPQRYNRFQNAIPKSFIPKAVLKIDKHGTSNVAAYTNFMLSEFRSKFPTLSQRLKDKSEHKLRNTTYSIYADDDYSMKTLTSARSQLLPLLKSIS